MLRRRLLTVLFICILLPVVVILVQSAATLLGQKKSTTEIAGRYVRSLATYAAERWNQGRSEEITAFFSLLGDEGYERFIASEPPKRPPLRENAEMRGKFIPGLVAYVTPNGDLIACSQNAAILVNIYEAVLRETGGRLPPQEGELVGGLRIGNRKLTYVAYIAPTQDPRVYTVAAVTMLGWMGRNDFNMMKLATAAILGMLVCLVALFLLRRTLIAPLLTLSSQVDTLEWGKALPPPPPDQNCKLGLERLQVEEVTSLQRAIHDLAQRMIEKDELERRYLGDIIQAQDDERGRIAQDIHDGPIQVLSALVQRIQMACIKAEDLSDSSHAALARAEEIAQDLVEDLRGVCDALVPPWVSLGIVSCMEEAASRFERQHAVQIDMDVEQDLETSPETTLALYRIFQEAVSNAVRHGGAGTINVQLARETDTGKIRFRIRDDGTGFDPTPEMLANLFHEGKRGINGMRQRIELLGGTYEIRSQAGEGTEILARF